MEEHEMAARRAVRRNRRSHRTPRRNRAVFVAFSEEEYAVVVAAAEREFLATGAYVAQAALAAAGGEARPEYAVLRELLAGLMQASGQARRIGINLNQSVAALNSGEVSQQSQWYAQAAARTVGKLDELADQVRVRLP
ncbi:hypothetical protein [Spirillospora sp. CA-294931]|uniref:hypothetical protein n=1 Tax=Spirillospora sp. CA-294931 TaxID=3240042 RepID=UPI003D8ECF46